MIRSSAFIVSGSFVLASFLASGCAAKNNGGSDDGTGAAGSDAAQVESDSESFGSMFASNSGGSLAPSSFSGGSLSLSGLPAGGSAANFPNLSPAGCVTETQDIPNKTNTYVFANCTGPWGFTHLKGTVTVVWSSTGANNLTLVFSAQNFEINRATITSWNATADITASGADFDMQWNGKFSGVTGGGRQFSRTNTKDIKWTVGQPCISIDGQSTGDVTGKNLTTKVITYKRCLAECPEADSEINIHNDDNGNDVDVKFNGGANADVTFTSNGKTESIDIPLVCGG